MKGLFFGLPSMSVVNTHYPFLQALKAEGHIIKSYNKDGFTSDIFKHDPPLLYPEDKRGYDTTRLENHISYINFATLLLTSTQAYVNFTIGEIEREQPDFILYSHLAMWAKLAGKYCRVPSVCLLSTFVLRREVMFPVIRAQESRTISFVNITKAKRWQHQAQCLFNTLGIKEIPDIWEAYVNQGDLNVAFLPSQFQPAKHLLGDCYRFVGFPRPASLCSARKEGIFISLGTIFNKDICILRTIIQAVSNFSDRVTVATGYEIDINQLGDIPRNVQLKPFVNQVEVLAQSKLFITQGGMASVQEAVHCQTPLLIVPCIPEQVVTAQSVVSLGIGTYLPAIKFNSNQLTDLLSNTMERLDNFARNLVRLRSELPKEPAPQRATAELKEFLASYHD